MTKYLLIALLLLLSSCKTQKEPSEEESEKDTLSNTECMEVINLEKDTLDYSQKRLMDINDELIKRFQNSKEESVKINVVAFSVGINQIDIHLIVNTPEKRKEFKQKIMNSPAFRFNGSEIPAVNEKTGVNDTLGIYLRPEYTVYSTDASEVNFILYNNSGIAIKCGEHYSITYQDEKNVWRELPINTAAIDIAYVIPPRNNRHFTASLYPKVHPNKPGRYRFFYDVWINRRLIPMSAEFRLTDKEQEWKQKQKTPVPPGMLLEVSGLQLKQLEEERDEAVYSVVEVMPEFPGGMSELLKFIESNQHYSKANNKNAKRERVIIQVIIDKNGYVTEPIILSSTAPALNEEALRIAKQMPQWKPGKQNGIAVKVRFTFPVNFYSDRKSDE